MAIPKEIIEWITYSYLDNYADVEMVILKGHLYIEIMLSEIVDDKNFSFYAKAKKFGTLTGMMSIRDLLLELNTTRNQLAHEWDFDNKKVAIENWADVVFQQIPYSVKFRRTTRTKLIHAICALAGAIIDQKDR